MSSQTLREYLHATAYDYKGLHWMMTYISNKNITLFQQTTVHHDRIVTRVLEPNYNLAHAPLNLSDLAYLLALAAPGLKLKQCQFAVRWSI